MSPATALRLVEVLAATGVLLSSLEWVSRRRTLDDTSLASWPVLRLRHPRYAHGLAGAALSPLAAYPAVLWLLTTRAAAAALLPAPLPARAHAAALAVVVGTGAVMSLRGTYGGESADQMLELVFCALLLAALRPTPAAPRLVLWFLALNACLAYATSGIYKVTSGAWRDGTNLTGVLSTRCHGDRRVAAWLTAHPVGAKWLSRGVGAWETLFPLVLVAPPIWLPVFLTPGLAFHAGWAVARGLDGSLWAFLALYPAVGWVVVSGG